MHRLLSSSLTFPQLRTLANRGNICRSLTKLSPIANVENQRCVDMANTGTMSQSHAATATVSDSLVHRSGRMQPLLESTVVSDTIEESTRNVVPTLSEEIAPLPFEEVPGPTLLKLWEKYWRYVPLLGRLTWNRNITPINYLFNKYGCIVRIRGPFSNDIVMIHRPEHIAEVFKQEGTTPIRSGIDILEHYRLHYRKSRLAGAFSLQNLEWLEFREKIEKPVTHVEPAAIKKLDAVSEEMIVRIRKIRNRQDEVPLQFHQDLIRWASECFFTHVFDKKLGFLEPSGQHISSEATKFVDALNTAHVYMSRCETGFQVWRFFETPFAKKLFSACDVLDAITAKYIRQAQHKQRNRLSYAQSTSNVKETVPLVEKLLTNQQINPDDISTLLMDMIILGLQAVANCEAFLLYFLAKSPRVQKKLYEEVISVIGHDSCSLTEENLKCMPYLNACLKESLRLCPAFSYLTRLLPNTITLHGYVIPKGTYVIMANQITSQREENFEDPEKFRPERWLMINPNEDINEYSYLPFGHGVRSCLGKYLAETQMALLTAKLIHQFRIEYNYADIGKSLYMMNVPNKPLRFRFVERD